MKKRLFEILDEMNLADIKDKTPLVSVSNAFVAGDKVKQGATITMGATEQVLMDIMLGKVVPILITVDKEEYLKRK